MFTVFSLYLFCPNILFYSFSIVWRSLLLLVLTFISCALWFNITFQLSRNSVKRDCICEMCVYVCVRLYVKVIQTYGGLWCGQTKQLFLFGEQKCQTTQMRFPEKSNEKTPWIQMTFFPLWFHHPKHHLPSSMTACLSQISRLPPVKLRFLLCLVLWRKTFRRYKETLPVLLAGETWGSELWVKSVRALSLSITSACSPVTCDGHSDPRCWRLMYKPWQASRGAASMKDSGKRKVAHWGFA